MCVYKRYGGDKKARVNREGDKNRAYYERKNLRWNVDVNIKIIVSSITFSVYIIFFFERKTRKKKRKKWKKCWAWQKKKKARSVLAFIFFCCWNGAELRRWLFKTRRLGAQLLSTSRISQPLDKAIKTKCVALSLFASHHAVAAKREEKKKRESSHARTKGKAPWLVFLNDNTIHFSFTFLSSLVCSTSTVLTKTLRCRRCIMLLKKQ